MAVQKILLISLIIVPIEGQLYEQTHAIFKKLFNSSSYHPQIRPVSNQSEAVHLNITFGLFSIVAIDDTDESFTCNGYCTFTWTDQRLQWNASDYGNQTIIYPLPKQLWRPQFLLMNTMNKRDPFADDLCITKVANNGTVTWSPGSLFTTSCSLNLQKYPFDEQVCKIKMCSQGMESDELAFNYTTTDLSNYTVNGEWHVEALIIDAANPIQTGPTNFEIRVHLKRRPTFYVLNVIMPFVLLSFLNLMVFKIPKETGEKIGYSITVLLALSVFFSIIDSMLPRSSRIVPDVVIYLFSVYVLSALTVIDSILIGYIYHVEEKNERRKKMKEQLKIIVSKLKKPKGEIAPNRNLVNTGINVEKEAQFSQFPENSVSVDSQEEDGRRKSGIRNNKALAREVEFYSSVLFTALWVAATLWFYLSVAG